LKPAINKEVKEEVLAKVKAGEAAASVAQKFGISVKTIYGWLRWFLASQPPGLEESQGWGFDSLQRHKTNQKPFLFSR